MVFSIISMEGVTVPVAPHSLGASRLRSAWPLHRRGRMTTDNRAPYLVRDQVLKLLSDHEIASVSTAETKPDLAQGDAYLDLEHLDLGVRHAGTGAATPMGSVLTEKAVRAETWTSIQALLATDASPEPTRLA